MAGWTRKELLVAFGLYCRIPFGRLHRTNAEIIRSANALGRSPSALAMKLTNIASLDPDITSTGRSGLTGASANDRAMWKEMHDDWESFALEIQGAMLDLEPTARPDDDAVLPNYGAPSGEDRAVEAKARIGQRFFRAAVLSAYGGRCCITGLSVPTLLVASHIVPWNIDKDNRVNPRNGLSLSALHDRAFDAGLLTINHDLTVRVSRNRATLADEFFATALGRYDGQSIHRPSKFVPSPQFLAYHRSHIFKG